MDTFSFRVVEFGIFDSNLKFPRMTESRDRLVDLFELEFFTSDYPGLSFINGKSYQRKYGTFICGKPGQTRRSQLPFRCHYFHLQTDDPALCAILHRLPDTGLFSQTAEVPRLFQEFLTLDPQNDPSATLLIQSCVCRLISMLSQQTSIDSESALHQDGLLAAERYIQAHFTEDLSLPAVAAIAKLSPIYFHKLFCHYFGKTPAQAILERRIASAKLGLLHENCDMSNLASSCGFSSQSYFCYKFKQVTGQTPLQYRKEMLTKSWISKM